MSQIFTLVIKKQPHIWKKIISKASEIWFENSILGPIGPEKRLFHPRKLLTKDHKPKLWFGFIRKCWSNTTVHLKECFIDIQTYTTKPKNDLISPP